jgi:AcrR family transcriptional regulator
LTERENGVGKTDVRIQFTRKMLRDSLLILMKEKSIQDISVKEICESAGLSRSTFYTYYKDQYDLLGQMEEDIFIDLDHFVRKYMPVKELPPFRELTVLIEDILRYITGGTNSVQILLSENDTNSFRRKFARYFFGRMRELKHIQGRPVPDERTLKYYATFVRDGCIAILQDWIKNGMDIEVPDLAKLLARLVRGVLG